MENQIVDEKLLQKALTQICIVIDLYGETYLPIFIRLQKELENVQKNNELLAKAKSIAKGD